VRPKCNGSTWREFSLKNKLRNVSLVCWQILTEVPGWPDAPRQLRLRRLLPIAIPVVAMLLLCLWNLVWAHPHIQSVRTTYQPLLALEQEVADLRLGGSDDKAAEAAARAAEASRMLLPEPKQIGTLLNEFTRTALASGWEATFQALPAPAASHSADMPVSFATVRAKLVPSASNPQAFASLLTYLTQFSPPNRSVDLTRLSVRADEQGRQTAEVFLRVGCRIPE
jgi:hypothetical protein